MVNHINIPVARVIEEGYDIDIIDIAIIDCIYRLNGNDYKYAGDGDYYTRLDPVDMSLYIPILRLDPSQINERLISLHRKGFVKVLVYNNEHGESVVSYATSGRLSSSLYSSTDYSQQ